MTLILYSLDEPGSVLSDQFKLNSSYDHQILNDHLAPFRDALRIGNKLARRVSRPLFICITPRTRRVLFYMIGLVYILVIRLNMNKCSVIW